jgi:hypothetical protein
MTVPNWGAFVAGEDTLGYYAQIQADTITQEALFEQKISAPEAENVFIADIEDPITGANFRGDATQGVQVDGQAFIPNALPGGYTP